MSTQYEAIIIGAGPSGIASAARLQLDLNLSNIRIFERGSAVGGTWFWNQYAGAACDVPPRLYSFSFHQRRVWKHFLAKQAEMQEYLEEVAQRFHLHPKTEFQTEVYSATWDEAQQHWQVKYRSVDHSHHAVATAKILINGSGSLSVPRECDVPGYQQFKGPLFHSAKWDPNVDLTDKNVVLLGNGCSATQILPGIAKKVKAVTQIVRAKHWYAPAPEDPLKSPAGKWMQANLPGFIYLERAIFTLLLDIHFIQAWNKEGKGARQRFAKVSQDYIKTVAPERYHHLLIPEEKELQVACKRRIFDNAYLPALNLHNVELTNDPAVRINADSVTLRSGRELPADVIIMASGFKTADTCVQMKVTGRNGVELNEFWKKQGAPQAYRSAMVHNFPNFFLIWGPNAVTGHYSAIYTIEASTRFMSTVVRPLFLDGSKDQTPLQRARGKSVEVSASAQDKEDAMITSYMKDLIYSSGCKGWYTNDKGRVSTLYPSFQMLFAWRSDHPIASDLIYKGLSQRPSATWSYTKQIASALRLGDVPECRPKELAKRSTFVKNAVQPLTTGATWLGTQFLLVYVWLLDVGFFYTRTEKDYERMKIDYLSSPN